MQGKRVALAQYPAGMPGHDDLKFEEFDLPSLGPGEV